MDYDMILPAIAGASGIFAGCAVLYSKIRPRFPVRVNCWFCNKDTKVEFRYQESWMCPSCQQYNGFTEDGDYNRDLPAQYCESLNMSPVNQRNIGNSPSRKRNNLAIGNGLCHTCNLNQTLKMRALADYTPIHPENYEKEIEDYRKRLENTYKLCRQCEATLHQTLGKQDSWLKPKLIAWRLQQTSVNKAKLSPGVKESNRCSPPVFLHLLHICGVILALALFLTSLHHLQQHSGVRILSLDFGMGLERYLVILQKYIAIMVVAGLSMLLMAIFGSGKEFLLVSDAVTSFMWVGLLALCSSRQLMPPSDYHSLQVLISGTTLVFMMWVSLVPRSISRVLMPTRSDPNKSVLRSECSSKQLDDSQCTLNASFSDELSDVVRPPSSPSSTTPPSPVGSVPHDSLATDLDETLGSLKISTPVKNTSRNMHDSTLSPRVLFSDKPGYKLNGSFCMQRNIVSPSRLSMKNITQSSWVAGGYWGHPVSPQKDYQLNGTPTFGSAYSQQSSFYPLSRSSSQSSGFVSMVSGPPSNRTQPQSSPNSRIGSHCGDYDRGSVLSEPAYKSWNYAPSLYPSDSASQCSYIRYPGQTNGDAQSLHSAGSLYSEPTFKRSPTPNRIDHYPTAVNGDILDSSGNSITGTITSCREATGYKSPWFPFFLGMSIAANGFLVAMLFMHTDIQSFVSKFKV